MNAAKRFLMIAGAFALATLSFTLANPKAVHAFAATLVQISNTASNPVPVDADNNARHAVRLYTFGNADKNGSYDAKLTDGSSPVFTVPAGKRLVMEQASLFAYPGQGKTVFAYWFDGFAYTALPVHDQDGFGDFEGLFTMRSYVDAGNSIELFVYTAPNTFLDMSVEGYLIDCNGVC